MNAISEDEQVETLKRWWKENGSSLVFGVVLALVAVYGWQAWQRHQATVRAESSMMYQSMMEAYVSAGEEDADETQIATFRHLSGELRDKYPETGYATFAAMQMARFLVDQGDLDGARAQLDWVLEQGQSGKLAELARARLVQVMLGQGEADAALAALEKAPASEVFAVMYLELQGDALLQLENIAEAGLAYRNAMALAEERGESRPILEMKLNDLGTGPEEA